jgi:hypothetical protein
MTFQDSSEKFPSQQQPQPWLDQLAQEMLLTAQAFHRLRAAFEGKFK